MTLSTLNIAKARFQTDGKSDALNTGFEQRLGMTARYQPARLALSRSLRIPATPDPIPQGTSRGKAIKGDTLFGTGTELLTWVSLIVQHAPDQVHDLDSLTSAVAAHWKRGLTLLDQDWTQSQENFVEFVRILVEHAGLSSSSAHGVREIQGPANAAAHSERLISVPVGEVSEDVRTGEKITWTLNDQGSSPHSAIMGGVGSGKTRTVASILQAIREQAPLLPMIAFDFKGDLGTDDAGKGYHLDRLFTATIIEPLFDATTAKPFEKPVPVPLDVLSIAARENEYALSHAADRFQDSFSNLKGVKLGSKQSGAVRTAAKRALRSNNPCRLDHFQKELINVYAEREMKEDGAVEVARKICEPPLFDPRMTPEEFFQQSWIIKLPLGASDESSGIVVNLILDALDRYLGGLSEAPRESDGSQGLRLIAVIDEAHRILGKKLKSLSSLIRMSRSKGGAVMLISQSPDDFAKKEEENFLNEMGLVAAFVTNAPPKNTARILGRGANLAGLEVGEAFVKLRGSTTAQRIQAWLPKTSPSA